jgi:hypothetical protein
MFVVMFSGLYMAILAFVQDSAGVIIMRVFDTHYHVAILSFTLGPMAVAAIYIILSFFSVMCKRVNQYDHMANRHALLYVSDSTSIALPVSYGYDPSVQ